MWDSIFLMLIHRWYVFLFLLAFLAVASIHWGLGRTIKFLLLGYAIAWGSEALSIRHGFPYGMYYYHYDKMVGEPFLLGVPLWDSLSYVFLSFSGYMMALFLRVRWDRFTPIPQLQAGWGTVLLGAALTMVLDIVIDPLATLGRYWFLGDVFHYPSGGLYFGVPLSNFAGWFLVALAILSLFRLTDSLLGVPRNPKTLLLGVGLFLGVYFFNLSITFYIGAWKLGLASVGWGMLLLILSLVGSQKRKVQM